MEFDSVFQGEHVREKFSGRQREGWRRHSYWLVTTDGSQRKWPEGDHDRGVLPTSICNRSQTTSSSRTLPDRVREGWLERSTENVVKVGNQTLRFVTKTRRRLGQKHSRFLVYGVYRNPLSLFLSMFHETGCDGVRVPIQTIILNVNLKKEKWDRFYNTIEVY